MSFFYAMLTDQNVCRGTCSLAGEVIQNDYIPIPEDNHEYYTGRKYENGEWSTEKFEIVTAAPYAEFTALKSDVEQRQEELFAAIADIVDLISSLMPI